jgi:hypothetical protein
MLPPYIIEELRRREEARREELTRPQPRLELPVERPRREPLPPPESERGIAIIEVF